MYMYSFYYLMIPAIIISMIASSKVKKNYNKFSKIRNGRGITGREIAEQILYRNHISHVQIKRGTGVMTDHYNPKTQTVTLSPHVYDGDSISSASIAAHECGHAVQHATNYVPLSIRASIAPATQVVSKSIGLLVIIGIVVARSGSTAIIDIAIMGYTLVALFHIVTLPVEFNASSRAITMLNEYGLVREEDIYGTKKVLNAAAFTYVAATLAALLTIVRLLAIRNRN